MTKAYRPMLKRFIGAFLVFRLELRQLPLELDLVWTLWRQPPAIELVLDQRAENLTERSCLRQRLDEVFPF